jgi:DNA-binding beta-propeller fold protein YncE
MTFRILVFLQTSLTGAMAFTHMEPRQQHPVSLTPDGKKLLALHSTAHTLSVFDVGTPARSVPLLIAEIPTSSGPVSVKARTNDEVWVVNEASDSVSVISLSQGIILDTLRTGDEPADLCFAAGKAFVSCAQGRVISVFDPATRTSMGQVTIDGISPRAMVANADGSKLYVSCLLSGNRSTILPKELAPAPPAPTNPALLTEATPQTALIVPASDSRIPWTVLDHDIAEIDTASQTIIRWIPDVGTHLFDLTLHPDGSLWCANSDSLNLTRFEPELNGEFARHRLSRITLPTAAVTHHDLNPGIVRATTPQPASIAAALAAPMAVAIQSNGLTAWIAAFQSDRIAEIDLASGNILRRIDIRPAGIGTEAMRGPRGLALTEDRLYVLNKIADSLTSIDPATGTVLSEVPLGSINPMPANIRAGRGVLYDARLSGNGTLSCATCHIDADRDGLAWDLGDPGGSMVDIIAAPLSIHGTTLFTQRLHPMKGPLTTQTLRGLGTNDAAPIDPTDGSTLPAAAIVTKFHWRGDKPSIQSFNTTFPNLMGGVPQAGSTMDHLAEYLVSIVHPPNPNLNLDRSLRTDHPKGDAANGKTVFLNHSISHCIVCHGFPAGTNQNLDDFTLLDHIQPFKNPPLSTVYQRAGIFNPISGASSLSGFGLGAEGVAHQLPAAHSYVSLSLIHNPPFTPAKIKALNDLSAFILSFDTGTAPAACFEITLTSSNKTNNTLLGQLATLETRASQGDNGLVAWGRLDGVPRRFQWLPATSLYLAEDQSRTFTRAALLNLLASGDALTFSGVLPSETSWRSTDRNSDNTADTAENPPAATIVRDGPAYYLRWPMTDWYPESSADLSPPWQPASGDPVADGDWWKLPLPTESQPTRFYRLHRTW